MMTHLDCSRVWQGALRCCGVVAALGLIFFGGSSATLSAHETESTTAAADDSAKDGGGKKEETKDKKEDSIKKDRDKKTDADKKDSEEPKPKVTHHTATIGGQEISFKAVAGKMLLSTDEEDAKPKARVFFTAYTKEESKESKGGEGSKETEASKGADEAAVAPRPVTFCFNGGPGSSSVWLHMGMLGPKRVKLDSDAKPLRPPHQLIDNPYSLLDVTDLVFIDPVSTGFSRPAKGEKDDQFHGYYQDLDSVAQFIHDYVSRYGRWGSPKFLIGESYGGLRAAGLSDMLQERYRMSLNGIVLVSAVVDFQTISTYGNNDVAYALFLPTYAATAWYHKALDEDLQKLPLADVVQQAERFAGTRYLHALTAGDSLGAKERRQVVRRMAALTGLSAEYVAAANLRVSMPQFGKELLRKRGLVVGRFDSRYTGRDHDQIAEYTEHDPSAAAVFGAFASAMNDYLRTELKVRQTGVYEILTDKVHPWNYSDFTNRYVDASTSLRSTMLQNPYLKVFAACGHYDLATPQFAMVYSRDHLDLPEEVRKNFTLGFYEGGHMMYAHEPSLVKLSDDLRKFYAEALGVK